MTLIDMWQESNAIPVTSRHRSLDPGLTVLVATNDAELREALGPVLRREGCRIVEAAGVAAVLDRLLDARINGPSCCDLSAIVINVCMPGLSVEAFGLLHELRCRIPVICLAPNLSPELELRVLRIGAQAVIRGPVDCDEIVGTVGQLCSTIRGDALERLPVTSLWSRA